MPKTKPTRSVADMPPQMRFCCEHLCSGASDPEIAARLNLSPTTVTAHLRSARKRTGTKTRGELVRWCNAGGHVRRVDVVFPYDTITTTSQDGRQVEIVVDAALRALGRQFPHKFLAEAARVRARLFPARQPAAESADAATDQPAPNAGTSAPDGLQSGSAR